MTLLERDVLNSVMLGDCLEKLKEIPDDSVHLILSDIPYGIGYSEWDVLHANTNTAYLGASPAQEVAGAVFKRRGKPINGWSQADKKISQEYYNWCMQWSKEWLRVLKPGGSAIVFSGRRYAPRCVVALEDAGFNFRDMLSWVRPRAVFRAQRASIVFDRRGDQKSAEKWEGWRLGNLRPSFEPIIWCFKPYSYTVADNLIDNELGAFNLDRFKEYFGEDNNIFCGFDKGESGLHEAQKPLKLMQSLIELTTRSGHIVLDPFSGSGTTLVAAKTLSRNYIGIDIDPDHVKTSLKRLITVQDRLI